MIIEKRTLPIGVEYEGAIHRELEIRPRLVRDMIAGANDPLTSQDKGNYEICCLASQVQKLGKIPKEAITGGLFLDMFEADFDVLTEAAEKARQRAGEFRTGGDPGTPGKEADKAAPSGDDGQADGARAFEDGVRA